MIHTNEPIHVFVVASALLCWGFEKLIGSSPGIRMTGSASSFDPGVGAVGGVLVDVLVVDHDEGYGPDALAQAAKLFPVLLLTGGHVVDVLERVRGTGIRAAVRKRDAGSMLVHAIESICPGLDHGRRSWDSYSFSPGRCADASGNRHSGQSRMASLTARERQLIRALVSNPNAPGKVIASRLGVSEHTLRNHLTSIYSKLGVQNRLGLHAFAAEHPLGDEGEPRATRPERRRSRAPVSARRTGRPGYGVPTAHTVGFELPVGISTSVFAQVQPASEIYTPK